MHLSGRRRVKKRSEGQLSSRAVGRRRTTGALLTADVLCAHSLSDSQASPFLYFYFALEDFYSTRTYASLLAGAADVA